MVAKTIDIKNRAGLHARPAALIVKKQMNMIRKFILNWMI